MAKRKTEVDDDGEQRAVFVDTSLNTHLVLLVSPTDTISLLKQKILLEHPKCFPNFGEIKINALKVKRRGCYYHLLDSMFVKTAFYGVAKNWFLFADASSQVVCLQTPSNDHATIPTGPSKTLPTLVASSKHLESGIKSNEDDHCGNYTSDVNKVSGLEMPNKSGVDDEFKLAEETLNPENLWDSNNKKTKKKRKRTGEHDGNGDENGERLEGLHRNRVGKDPVSTEIAERSVGDGTKSTNNVVHEVSSPTRAKKKHKVVHKDAQEVSLSKTKTLIDDYDRVAPELRDVVSKSGQEDMRKNGSGDVNDLQYIRDSKDTKKRKKEKRHGSSELASLKINKQDVQEGTQSLYQLEGTRTSSDKVNSETENEKVGGLGSRAKKTKKAKKGDVDGVDRSNPTRGSEMPDILENGVAPTQNKNTIHAQENSATESVELETRAKKKKVKKGKVSITEKTDLSSMENNKDAATCILSNGHVGNDKNDDFIDKADREDSTHQTNKKRNIVKTSSISSWDGDQEADDTRKVGAEPLQTAEIDKPSVSVEIRGEKAKRKTQKKQTVSIKDSPEFSVKEKSGEKITETDMLKTDDVNLSVDGDLHEDTNKTPLPEISVDVAEVRKADRRASKQKVKKLDLPSSVDTLCSGHNMVSSKESRGSERTSHDVTKKDDDPEAPGIEALQPPPIDKAEENMEMMSDKSKKKTGKKQSALKDPLPKSPMKERFDEKTREMAVPKSANGDLLVNTVVNDASPQGEASLVEDCNEKLEDIPPLDTAGLAEVRNQDKPHTSKQVVKKFDLPSSSVDTSSNQPSLSKSKKSKKGERTSQNGTQPSEKPSGTFEEGIETQDPHADPINSVTKLALHNENGSAKTDMGIGSPNRKTHQGKKTKEPQKKPGENPVGSRRSTRKNMGEVVNNASPQKKGLLATPGAIFEDGSSASSDDEDKMDGSDCSTRTPSDHLSSSDYSEGESKGDVVTSQHDASKGGVQNGANSNSFDLKNLTLHTVLRSSSRYKKAKVIASQSQLEDSEQPVDFVPDSQANL